MTEGEICPFISGVVRYRYQDNIGPYFVECIRERCKAWEWDDEHIKEGHCKLISGGK